MTTKYMVCDPACEKPCKQAPSVTTKVRECSELNCIPRACCADAEIACIPATPEEIASAKLRGLI